MSYYVFIADCHLSAHHHKRTDAFIDFLKMHQPACGIYILGDLFDYWVGEDDPAPFIQTVITSLQATTRKTDVWIMPGNRDFLLSKPFFDQTGCQLLNDPSLVTLFDRRYLLTHGDTYCTQDRAYQRYRRIVRHPITQNTFRILPLSIRLRLAHTLQQHSQQATAQKTTRVMQIQHTALVQHIDQFKPDYILHGHIHHHEIVDHHASQSKSTRIAIKDWCANQRPYLKLTSDTIEHTMM